MGSGQEMITNSRELSYLAESMNERMELESPLLLTSFELLSQHQYSKVKRSREGNPHVPGSNELSIFTNSGFKALSTASLMKFAREELLQCKSRKASAISTAASHFGPQHGFSSQLSQDLELAMLIQAAAEKVAHRKYVYARKLLSRCDQLASKAGNPVQRVAYYFAEALKEKIDREWEFVLSYEVETKVRKPIDVEQAQIHLQRESMECQQEQPFCLESQFVGCQCILEYVASAKKVHLIDLGIENGSHWTLIMQSLADRYEFPLELLKITAVGTSRELLQQTGKWLSSFAETLCLPFSFNVVVSDLKGLKSDLFELGDDEEVAIYSGLRLWTLLAWPYYLDALMRVIKNLKPCVVVVREMEARTNSPVFLERFQEALLLFSGIFDCLNDSMDHQILYRKMLEEVILWERIQNILTAEGSERIHRHERIGYWRVLFAKFGMVEIELSKSTLSQSNWLLRRSSRFDSCNLDMDGRCLIMSWKGVPFQSLSAWKFLTE